MNWKKFQKEEIYLVIILSIILLFLGLFFYYYNSFNFFLFIFLAAFVGFVIVHIQVVVHERISGWIRRAKLSTVIYVIFFSNLIVGLLGVVFWANVSEFYFTLFGMFILVIFFVYAIFQIILLIESDRIVRTQKKSRRKWNHLTINKIVYCNIYTYYFSCRPKNCIFSVGPESI